MKKETAGYSCSMSLDPTSTRPNTKSSINHNLDLIAFIFFFFFLSQQVFYIFSIKIQKHIAR